MLAVAHRKPILYRVTEPETPIMAQYAQSVPAGFPSPAADYMEEEINLMIT